MKIAIYQINTTVGNFKGNESKILKGIDLAKRKEASLAIFPEMATFGYPPRDLLDKPYLVDANIAVANRIAKQTTKDFGCIFGFIARNENKIGRGLFNAAALAFDYQGDRQALELVAELRQRGIDAVLHDVASLNPDETLTQMIKSDFLFHELTRNKVWAT